MARQNAPFVSFNGGEIGREVQGRINLEGYAATAGLMENFWPFPEGSMALRPGFGFLTEIGRATHLKKWVFSIAQKYLMAFSDNQLRVIQDGGVVFRPAVNSHIVDTAFAETSIGIYDAVSSATLTSSTLTSGSLTSLRNGSTADAVVWNSSATGFVRAQLSPATARTVRSMQLSATTTPTRAPSAFTLAGSNTGAFTGEQTVLLTVTGAPAWSSQETRLYKIAAPAAFLFYRLDMTNTSAGTGSYQLSEWRLPVSNWVQVVTSGSVGGSSGLVLATTSRLLQGAEQNVVIAAADQGVLHALDINVTRGPVTLRVGSTSGGDDYITDTVLRAGRHSLAFTPTTGNAFVRLSSTLRRQIIVASCAIATTGDMVLVTPWLASAYTTLRFQQSKDVLYVTDGVNTKKRIERRSSNSWSVVDSDEKDGPFLSENVDDAIYMTPSVREGNGTLTCTRSFFRPGHVGALFKITHNGQYREIAITGGDQWTEPIKVTGSQTAGRQFNWTAPTGGVFVGTVRLQASFDEPVDWANTRNATGTEFTTVGSATPFSYSDAGATVNDNQTWYYRLGMLASEYTSGNPLLSITYHGGSMTGICRITGYVSATQVNIEVLTPFGAMTGSAIWAEGAWSQLNGYPKAVDLFDGRLWNGLSDDFWGSKSEQFESQEIGEKDGDAIARSISAEADPIVALIPLARQVVMTEGSEVVLRSSSFDEPITPTNLTVRTLSSYGSGDVEPLKVDSQGVFVDRSSIHMMALAYNVEIQDYVAKPLTRLHKNIGRPGIIKLAVARRPDTRLFALRSDGQLLTKLYEPGENVLGWARATGEFIYSIEVLPGTGGEGQDEVWAIIKRRLATGDKYYLEKLGDFYFDHRADANCLDSYVRATETAVEAAQFDGTSYMSRGALSGAVDGKQGTVSFWVRLDAEDNEDVCVYCSTNESLIIRRNSQGKWEINGKSTAAASILTLISANSWGQAAGWHHVTASWDLATTTGRMVINGQSDLDPGTVLVNQNIDYTQANHVIGARASFASKLKGDLSQVYLNFAASLDLSSATVLAKFRTVAEWPVNLSSNGSGPSGATPAIFLKGDETSFQTNSGAGGSFTITGILWEPDSVPKRYLAYVSTVFSGFTHLEGRSIAIFADGQDLGDFTVSAGAVNIAIQAAQVVGGVRYTGRYKSSKLAFAAQAGTPLGQRGQPDHIIFLLGRSTRYLSYGGDFDVMDDLSAKDLSDVEDDDSGDGLETGVSEQLSMPGTMRRDPRVCLEARSPNPVNLIGYVLGHKLVERT